MAQAAQVERLTPSGYVAQVLQNSFTGAAGGEQEPLRRLLAGLVEATVAVARLARSVGDQGGPPDGLEPVLDRLDEATLAVLDELRWSPSRAGGRR